MSDLSIAQTFNEAYKIVQTKLYWPRRSWKYDPLQFTCPYVCTYIEHKRTRDDYVSACCSLCSSYCDTLQRAVSCSKVFYASSLFESNKVYYCTQGPCCTRYSYIRNLFFVSLKKLLPYQIRGEVKFLYPASTVAIA